ncbi:hypothetical protein CC86DRAFT_431409 [Ophiobolus disseminans]|uniref:Uncharacterized protein n=1 Tax=Ophiobolus disseminans TaxID=1469910 RepID=A0A6A7AFB2_9PLEO|nr:hypothetical protein CC86DRAFT_431409 [Ophiobolus disseminans]
MDHGCRQTACLAQPSTGAAGPLPAVDTPTSLVCPTGDSAASSSMASIAPVTACPLCVQRVQLETHGLTLRTQFSPFSHRAAHNAGRQTRSRYISRITRGCVVTTSGARPSSPAAANMFTHGPCFIQQHLIMLQIFFRDPTHRIGPLHRARSLLRCSRPSPRVFAHCTFCPPISAAGPRGHRRASAVHMYHVFSSSACSAKRLHSSIARRQGGHYNHAPNWDARLALV